MGQHVTPGVADLGLVNVNINTVECPTCRCPMGEGKSMLSKVTIIYKTLTTTN